MSYCSQHSPFFFSSVAFFFLFPYFPPPPGPHPHSTSLFTVLLQKLKWVLRGPGVIGAYNPKNQNKGLWRVAAGTRVDGCQNDNWTLMVIQVPREDNAWAPVVLRFFRGDAVEDLPERSWWVCSCRPLVLQASLTAKIHVIQIEPVWMILSQVHLRKPCYDFLFLPVIRFMKFFDATFKRIAPIGHFAAMGSLG